MPLHGEGAAWMRYFVLVILSSTNAFMLQSDLPSLRQALNCSNLTH